jgi:hypothetical protein
MKNLQGMKHIEDILRENRNLFEDNEPIEGHLERFNWKLEKRLHSNATRRSIVPYLLRAAVVTVLVTLSSLWTWDHFIRSDRGMTLSQVSPQYKEVESYYVHQVNLMEGELKGADFTSDPAQKTELQKELRSMDSTYTQLQKDLKANPNDERIITAMIEHYQTKVEVMSYIINQLKTIRNENQNKHGNENGKVSL